MELVHALEALRTPFWDGVMGVATYLGHEILLTVAAFIMLWSVDKRWGYRMSFMGLCGSAINMFLKAIFVVPRPWAADPKLTIVESARSAAQGYSFPSGHTTSAAIVTGSLAVRINRVWAYIAAGALTLLTAFSRLYLGVHTPLDVIAGLVTGVAVVVGLTLLFRAIEGNRRALYITLGAGLALCIALLLFSTYAPAGAGHVAQFDDEGLKIAYTVLGSMVGLLFAWWMDDAFVKYDIRAAWWAQIIKCVVGFALIYAVKTFLKQPLYDLFSGHYVADAVRYFLIIVTGGLLWPLTFKLFAKTYRKKAAQE